jgi:hypothetical protein
MSMQIRQLVMKSLLHFLDLINVYKVSSFIINSHEIITFFA